MEKTRKAKLISIDGLDGSGKNTQSELLRDRLRAEGCTAEVVSFPMYGSPSCFAVEMYLSGAFGGHPDDTGAYPAATFFAVDRYISMRTTWGKLLDTCDYIIFNRYTSANAVHHPLSKRASCPAPRRRTSVRNGGTSPMRSGGCPCAWRQPPRPDRSYPD